MICTASSAATASSWVEATRGVAEERGEEGQVLVGLLGLRPLSECRNLDLGDDLAGASLDPDHIVAIQESAERGKASHQPLDIGLTVADHDRTALVDHVGDVDASGAQDRGRDNPRQIPRLAGGPLRRSDGRSTRDEMAAVATARAGD